MTAKEFIKDWYGTPIPSDWNLEHEPLQNLSINDLERMLKQHTLSVIEKAVRDEKKANMNALADLIGNNILTRIKQATFTNGDN